MKIAIVTPAGRMSQGAYAHVLAPCLLSQSEFADRVYVVQSFNEPAPELPDNVQFVSRAGTWLGETYSGLQINRNLNTGFEIAQRDGCDVAIVMTTNSYIPEPAAAHLFRQCTDLLKVGANVGWVYRGDFLAGALFAPGKRLPYMLRLSAWPDSQVSFAPDLAYDFGRKIEPAYGDYAGAEYGAIIDAGFEMTLDELAEKMNFARCYADLMPKREPVFEWEYWRKYYINKLSRRRRSAIPLDRFGAMLAEISAARSDFISHELLEELE